MIRWNCGRVHNLRTTVSIAKKKPPGPNKTARTPDIIERVRSVLSHVPEMSISRFGYIPLAPRSPYLSTCDFFLWGYLKSRVTLTDPAHWEN